MITAAASIIVSVTAFCIAIYGLNYGLTRPKSRYTTSIITCNTLTLLVSSASITNAFAHLGEPQACWLVADMLGVAIDACQP